MLLFYTPLSFSDVFRGYRKATQDCNGLNSLDHVKYFFAIVLSRQKLPLLRKTEITHLIMQTEYGRNSKKKIKKIKAEGKTALMFLKII